MPDNRHDVIILGGGLAGGLAALALRAEQPELGIALVESGEKIGGNHLWSLFDSDIDPANRALVEPLIAHRWPGYDVAFPAHRRRIEQSYSTIESERLDTAVRAALPKGAIIRSRAIDATPDRVTLDDGRSLVGGVVIDARGLTAAPAHLACGWQKFVGQMLTVDGGHGLDLPVVMDATVDQAEGYRFVYCLPFSATEIFVEDTYYSDTPDLNRAELAHRIAAYAKAQGWRVTAINREEQGVLPVVMAGDFDAFWPAADAIARIGVRAALFHPLTSYSIPDAVRTAGWLARKAPLDARFGAAARQRARAHWHGGRFERLLARMLFRAADPADRYRVLQRFYRLPAPLIARFYAGRSTWADQARILSGKPPVSVVRAIIAMMEKL